jgi:predicted GNAT family acetyltransferase
MAGERMRCHEYQEMSAICTHPDFLGRGYAQRLLAVLTNRTLDRGVTPFLHVDRANTRARSVYDRLGYRERAALPFASVTRRILIA